MRAWTYSVMVITIGFVGATAAVAQPGKELAGKAERVAVLIRQLGDAEFAKRQAASKELEAIGEVALPDLRKAAGSGDNVETRRRAEQLIRAITAQKTAVVLMSTYASPGLPLAESKHPVYAIAIEVQVNAKGEGQGKITLNVTPPNYDEYGDFVTGHETDLVDRSPKSQRPPIVLDCTIEFVKTGFIGRVNTPAVNRSIFRIKGLKITSPLLVATIGPGLTTGRLLVLGKDQRVEHVIELTEIKPHVGIGGEGLPPPCHPGCFPAGTLVLVPDGSKRIDLIRKGDTVTTIGADGRAARTVVQEVFTSKNQLVEMRTDNGTLVTTAAQPLCLIDGSMRRAGDLKAGDRIWQWRKGRRIETAVRAVTATGKEAPVFNLIVGNSAIFVAGDFLARGKPPADGDAPAVGATPAISAHRGEEGQKRGAK